jgi:hypothetical protein
MMGHCLLLQSRSVEGATTQGATPRAEPVGLVTGPEDLIDQACRA